MFPLARVPFWYRFFDPQPYLFFQKDSLGRGIPKVLGIKQFAHGPKVGLVYSEEDL